MLGLLGEEDLDWQERAHIGCVIWTSARDSFNESTRGKVVQKPLQEAFDKIEEQAVYTIAEAMNLSHVDVYGVFYPGFTLVSNDKRTPDQIYADLKEKIPKTLEHSIANVRERIADVAQAGKNKNAKS